MVIYGHSLGGAAAACLLARMPDGKATTSLPSHGTDNAARELDYTRISGLILENPFASIEGMVRALYPQRWLPYHHLAPLAFDKWDAARAMRYPQPRSVLSRLRRDTLLLVSEKDEIVPRSMGEEIWAAARQCQSREGEEETIGKGKVVVVRDALHENMWSKRQWAEEIRRYIEQG